MQWKLLKVVFVQKINYLIVFVLFLSFQFKGISELIVYFMPAAMVWLFKEPNIELSNEQSKLANLSNS